MAAALPATSTGTITDLTTPIREVEAVTNFRRVDTGKDEEPLAEARLRGPRDLLKTRNRAVTLEDLSTWRAKAAQRPRSPRSRLRHTRRERRTHDQRRGRAAKQRCQAYPQ